MTSSIAYHTTAQRNAAARALRAHVLAVSCPQTATSAPTCPFVAEVARLALYWLVPAYVFLSVLGV